MKMLGHIAVGAFCSCCAASHDTRKTKRREARLVRREIEQELAERV